MSSPLFRRPDLYPVECHFDRGVLVFAAMTPESYREASFLDGRCVQRDDDVYLGRLERLLARFAEEQVPPRPLHFIAHTAFCCSTLLARCLGELHSCLALREPQFLVQVAERREAGGRWSQLLDFTTALLARTFRDDQTALVKLNDRCNGIVPELLAREPAGRGLLLYGDVGDFVVSVLRHPGRRIWLREHRLPLVREDAARYAPLAGLDPDRLDDAEAAAYLWLYRLYAYLAWTSAHPDGRLAALCASDLLQRRHETLAALARHFGLRATARELETLAASPLFDRYAKDPEQPFDAEAETEARGQLAPEVASGRALAASVTAAHPLPRPLAGGLAPAAALEPSAALADLSSVGAQPR